MSNEQAVRRVATEVWRGARPAEAWRVHGLNSEGAVRRRLSWLAVRLVTQADLPGTTRETLESIDWFQETPSSISTIVAALVDCVDDLAPTWARGVARLYVVQLLAQRLGWWPAGAEEAEDAAIGHGLYADIVDPFQASLVDTLKRARELHVLGEVSEAIRYWMSADRQHRTPMPLLHVGALLCRVGRVRDARWAMRAALLEPEAQFPSSEVFQKTRRLAAQLSLTMAAQKDTTQGSLVAAQRASADLDTSTLTLSATQPPARVPPTRPVRTKSAFPKINELTAPLAPDSVMAAILAASTTTPFISKRSAHFPAPVPSAPMGTPDPTVPPTPSGPDRAAADEVQPTEPSLTKAVGVVGVDRTDPVRRPDQRPRAPSVARLLTPEPTGPQFRPLERHHVSTASGRAPEEFEAAPTEQQAFSWQIQRRALPGDHPDSGVPAETPAADEAHVQLVRAEVDVADHVEPTDIDVAALSFPMARQVIEVDGVPREAAAWNAVTTERLVRPAMPGVKPTVLPVDRAASPTR